MPEVGLLEACHFLSFVCVAGHRDGDQWLICQNADADHYCTHYAIKCSVCVQMHHQVTWLYIKI